jgi:hypothetical protein
MGIRALVLAIGLLPAPVAAACVYGSPPSYEDITTVSVGQYSLVGQSHPSFQYKGYLTPRSTDPKKRAAATLTATRAVKFNGNFVAADPERSFHDIVATLERNHFFDLRLSPAPETTFYLDGPEDRITVQRCGVTTTLGTVASGGQVNLNDAQGKAFVSLEGDLRNIIFSQKWVTVPAK